MIKLQISMSLRSLIAIVAYIGLIAGAFSIRSHISSALLVIACIVTLAYARYSSLRATLKNRVERVGFGKRISLGLASLGMAVLMIVIPSIFFLLACYFVWIVIVVLFDMTDPWGSHGGAMPGQIIAVGTLFGIPLAIYAAVWMRRNVWPMGLPKAKGESTEETATSDAPSARDSPPR